MNELWLFIQYNNIYYTIPTRTKAPNGKRDFEYGKINA